MVIDWLNPTTEMLNGLQAGRDESAAEIEDRDDRIAALEKERSDAMEAVNSRNEVICQDELKQADTDIEVARLEVLTGDLEKELDVSLTVSRSLEKDVERLEKERDDRIRRINKLSDECEEYNYMHVKLNAETERLRAVVVALDKQRSQATGALDDINGLVTSCVGDDDPVRLHKISEAVLSRILSSADRPRTRPSWFKHKWERKLWEEYENRQTKACASQRACKDVADALDRKERKDG